jgi:hypothetical protein
MTIYKLDDDAEIRIGDGKVLYCRWLDVSRNPEHEFEPVDLTGTEIGKLILAALQRGEPNLIITWEYIKHIAAGNGIILRDEDVMREEREICQFIQLRYKTVAEGKDMLIGIKKDGKVVWSGDIKEDK